MYKNVFSFLPLYDYTMADFIHMNIYPINVTFLSCLTGQFLIQNVIPQASGESAKVKVKVRVNVHGVFSVSSASLVEVLKTGEGEEPMETDQTGKEEEVCAVCVYIV